MADIDACKFLYLAEAVGAPGNSLRLVLDEASAGPKPTSYASVLDGFPAGDRAAIATVLSGSSPIEHSSDDRTFEVTWEGYVAFAITDETFALGESGSPADGSSLFEEFRESKFLDYIASSTHNHFKEERRHWSIYCLNHCIDVVSTTPPTIRLIQ